MLFLNVLMVYDFLQMWLYDSNMLKNYLLCHYNVLNDILIYGTL